VNELDAGSHYRFVHRIKVTELDLELGYIDIKLDPFRVAKIWGMTCFAAHTILKKISATGKRGYKDEEQDLKDIICAAERKLEMLEEDKQ